ncbi:MAG: site-specific integrase [Proteobacteria bacterium]|nr:site-specific integrase [Pseudomonadota bacterium]
MASRTKTKYPGVFYLEGRRIGGAGTERIYYAVFRKDGKLYEEMVGRQHKNNMTPRKASDIRGELIEGKRLPAKERRAAEQAERDAVDSRPTIDNLWVAYTTAREKKKGLRHEAYSFRNHISPAFGSRTPEQITTTAVSDFRKRLEENLKPKTVSNVLEILRRVIRFSIEKRDCSCSAKFEMPEVNNISFETLSDEELARLLAALDSASNKGVARIMRLAMVTGLRRGELLKLEWRDIDFEKGFVHLRDPKGGKDAQVPLNEQARTILSDLPKKSVFVFPGPRGGKRVEVVRAARKICDAAGLPKDFRPFHGLRHAYASRLVSNGLPLIAVQALLTHKSSRMTERYAHLADAALKSAATLAGGLMTLQPQAVVQADEQKQ